LIELQTSFQQTQFEKKLNCRFLRYLGLKIGYASVSTMTLVVKKLHFKEIKIENQHESTVTTDCLVLETRIYFPFQNTMRIDKATVV